MKLSSLLPARRPSRAFTLVELLVVIAIIGILVALLLPAIQAAREAARRAQCQSNLKNVALAVLNYESAQNILPMGTQFPRPLSPASIQTNMNFRESWAISVLPQMENQPLYDSFNLNVAISHNDNLDERGTVLPVMLCPTDQFNQVKYQGGPGGPNWARGNYAANVGNGAMYVPGSPAPHRINGPDSPGWNGRNEDGTATSPPFPYHRTRGVMGPDVASTLGQITDGTSKTIMLAEIRAGINETDPRGCWAFGHAGGNLVVWYASGGDANGPNYCGPDADDIGGNNLLCSGNSELLTQCMTCFGGSAGGSFDQATARSAHVGGLFVALCDGSVQFISDDIQTSGPYGTCCTPWDHLVASQDGTDPGPPGRPPRQ
jgi:prepilin-type N-terminal cleavage/methylation domain-containing protein